MSQVTIGGDRLGSGNKMKASMRNFERSTHDLSYLWKSTMSIGTLVPFMSQLALPGDTFDITLDSDVMTLPTSGPLFGNFKLQLDVFQVPIRLYNAKLHMNKLGIGMNMSEVKLPQFALRGPSRLSVETGLYADIDNSVTNPSSILSYLGVRGTGFNVNTNGGIVRNFNAVPFLGYWDIYKQYYANKQEEIGVVIHTGVGNEIDIIGCSIDGTEVPTNGVEVEIPLDENSVCQFGTTEFYLDPTRFELFGKLDPNEDSSKYYRCVDIFDEFEVSPTGNTYIFSNSRRWPNAEFGNRRYNTEPSGDAIDLSVFELDNIDDMRENLLKHFADDAYIINNETLAPYGLPFQVSDADFRNRSVLGSQEGLAIKTYNSDLFNNWISTEWIDGDNGISAITAVDTSEGNFTIDELNLSKKVYDMLNRIALSGGSYDDWLDAVYTHDRQKAPESPIYLGGMMQTVGFQEVVSTSVVQVEGSDPLGTLAGKGRLIPNKKGGKVVVKVDEPSYIMAIASLTPKVDYSQGNAWDTTLKTLDDLHKPSLDQIGFQDLITDQLAWFDTLADGNVEVYKSAGKQPAWINYMTNVDVARGNFAIRDNQMFMTLNRKYEYTSNGIGDLTTYIDPSKYNDIFADTALDAQNFWVQIACNITARRKMSAKIIPNL